MTSFLTQHISVVIPAIIAVLGASALAVDIAIVRPRRKDRTARWNAERHAERAAGD